MSRRLLAPLVISACLAACAPRTAPIVTSPEHQLAVVGVRTPEATVRRMAQLDPPSVSS